MVHIVQMKELPECSAARVDVDGFGVRGNRCCQCKLEEPAENQYQIGSYDASQVFSPSFRQSSAGDLEMYPFSPHESQIILIIVQVSINSIIFWLLSLSEPQSELLEPARVRHGVVFDGQMTRRGENEAVKVFIVASMFRRA